LSIENGQSCTVAKSPDEAFGGSGHDLAVLAEIIAVRRKEEHGAVKGAAITFDHADDEIDFVFGSSAGERDHGGSRNVNTRVVVTAKVFAAAIASRTDDGAEVEPTRIGGNEGFGEDN